MTRKLNRSICAFVLLGGAASMAGIASAQTMLTAGGATFPEPIYSKWFHEYEQKTKVQINYQSQGSGFGIQQVTAGTIDFGASDRPMTDDEIKGYKDKHGGSGILHFPTVLGANVAVYNVDGVTTSLNLTPQSLAAIFLGTITKWNDPAIANDNKGVNLPSATIVVVHRTDSSGTTFVWTDYLTSASPEWKAGPGKGQMVQFPVGLAAKGSEGVAGLVKQQKNSIGYVELTYAKQNKIQYAKIKNSAGVFSEATMAGVTASAAGAIKEMPADYRVSIVNQAGKDVYPISTFTYLLIPEKIADAGKKKAIVDFLRWGLTEGQKQAPTLDYAPLPKQIADRELKDLAKIH
jgi:phosphate transport system substrate-binding protein